MTSDSQTDSTPSPTATPFSGGWRLIAGPTPGPTPEDLAPLAGRTVVVVGYGNQGRAHARNLADSGISTVVALRDESPSRPEAIEAGLEVATPEAAIPRGDLVLLAVPDRVHGVVDRTWLVPHAKSGAVVGVLHGHSIHTGELSPRKDLGVVMVAPKGPGTTLRARYLDGTGIPALVSIERDPLGTAREIALAWARAIGCGRSGLVETTAAAETASDLFGEQAVLCGGVLAMISSAFEVLVERGCPAELAYLECIHELKQVVDLVYARGPSGMRAAISETAEFGALEVWRDRDRMIDRTWLRERLESILAGEFSRRMADDQSRGDAWLRTARRDAERQDLEAAGRAVRGLMPWLAKGDRG